MGRDTSHYSRLLKAISNLTLNPDRVGQSTTSLGTCSSAFSVTPCWEVKKTICTRALLVPALHGDGRFFLAMGDMRCLRWWVEATYGLIKMERRTRTGQCQYQEYPTVLRTTLSKNLLPCPTWGLPSLLYSAPGRHPEDGWTDRRCCKCLLGALSSSPMMVNMIWLPRSCNQAYSCWSRDCSIAVPGL